MNAPNALQNIRSKHPVAYVVLYLFVGWALLVVIGNTERMDKMNELGCKAYTMGSALFQGNFVKGGTFRENLEFVLNYREGKQG